VQDYISGVAPKGKDSAVSSPHSVEQVARQPAVQGHPDSQSVRIVERSVDRPQNTGQQQLSLEELREMLRRINLTFDLFEIAAEYSIDDDNNRVKVVVRNTRTGRVIRRIPPSEFVTEFYDLRRGLGLRINASV
jgi:uncharacterized FlaG/YvyC family protein